MEEKKTSVEIENRKRLRLTGITEVIRFQEEEAEFSSLSGSLQITGENLHMEKLNLDESEVILTGLITSLYYPDTQDAPQKGLWKRLFSS